LLQREQRLKEHLCNVREMASILEELLAWLSIAENTMDTLEAEPLPDDLPFVEILVKDHQDFMEDMAKRQPEMDRFCRTRTPDQENSQIPRILRSRSAFASKIINNSIHQLSFFLPRQLQTTIRTVYSWATTINSKIKVKLNSV
jgi:hypothetical protein